MVGRARLGQPVGGVIVLEIVKRPERGHARFGAKGAVSKTRPAMVTPVPDHAGTVGKAAAILTGKESSARGVVDQEPIIRVPA
jgi:hypothetical protein